MFNYYVIVEVKNRTVGTNVINISGTDDISGIRNFNHIGGIDPEADEHLQTLWETDDSAYYAGLHMRTGYRLFKTEEEVGNYVTLATEIAKNLIEKIDEDTGYFFRDGEVDSDSINAFLHLMVKTGHKAEELPVW